MPKFDEDPAITTKYDSKNNGIFFNARREGETSKYTITIDKGFFDGQKIPLDESPASVERVRRHLIILLSDPANCSIKDSRKEHMFDDFDDDTPGVDDNSENVATYLTREDSHNINIEKQSLLEKETQFTMELAKVASDFQFGINHLDPAEWDMLADLALDDYFKQTIKEANYTASDFLFNRFSGGIIEVTINGGISSSDSLLVFTATDNFLKGRGIYQTDLSNKLMSFWQKVLKDKRATEEEEEAQRLAEEEMEEEARKLAVEEKSNEHVFKERYDFSTSMINERDDQDYTPLMRATLNNDIDLVLNLLNNGANPKLEHDESSLVALAKRKGVDKEVIDVIIRASK